MRRGVAVIGAGRAGRARARALEASPRARLVHLVSRGPTGALPLERALTDPEVGAVIVCTPNLSHASRRARRSRREARGGRVSAGGDRRRGARAVRRTPPRRAASCCTRSTSSCSRRRRPGSGRARACSDGRVRRGALLGRCERLDRRPRARGQRGARRAGSPAPLGGPVRRGGGAGGAARERGARGGSKSSSLSPRAAQSPWSRSAGRGSGAPPSGRWTASAADSVSPPPEPAGELVRARPRGVSRPHRARRRVVRARKRRARGARAGRSDRARALLGYAA